jgi:hypothetical protein
MTAEVEALLERLDDISSRSGHEWNAAKDAAALIRAQEERITQLADTASTNFRAAVDAQERAEAAEAKLAAAARQEPCAWVSTPIPWNPTDGWACVWLSKVKTEIATMPFYAATVPAAIPWIDPDSGEQRITPRPSPHKKPPSDAEQTTHVPAGDAVSVRADVVSFLHGEGPLDGVHFGGRPDTQSGPYWWRKYLPESK